MLKLIVDTMGGDNGSTIIVDAILEFLKNHQDVEINVIPAGYTSIVDLIKWYIEKRKSIE